MLSSCASKFVFRVEPMIDRTIQEIEVGRVYTGKVVSITRFGAFMEVLPGKGGLVHVSEIARGQPPVAAE